MSATGELRLREDKRNLEERLTFSELFWHLGELTAEEFQGHGAFPEADTQLWLPGIPGKWTNQNTQVGSWKGHS